MTHIRKTLLITATAITLGLAGTQAAQADWYGHGPGYGGFGHGYYFNGHGDWHRYGWFDGYHAWHFYPGFYGVRPYYLGAAALLPATRNHNFRLPAITLPGPRP